MSVFAVFALKRLFLLEIRVENVKNKAFSCCISHVKRVKTTRKPLEKHVSSAQECARHRNLVFWEGRLFRLFGRFWTPKCDMAIRASNRMQTGRFVNCLPLSLNQSRLLLAVKRAATML
jgi:hypothetical protein